MKSAIILLFLFCTGFSSFAEKVEKYKASNGVAYQVGDTIKFGKGSGNNGEFVYVQTGNASMIMGNAPGGVNRGWSGFNAIIKKIKQVTVQGATVTYFVVGTNGPARFNVMIEDALATNEVISPKAAVTATADANKSQEPDKIKMLKDLKDLLDSGILTQDEFNAEKKKILEGKF